MHSLIGVILPFQYDEPKLTDAISYVLRPWDENAFNDDEEEINPNGQWDWWRLGGRWTGIWSNYEPRKDPANYETCFLCHGTGRRVDENARTWRQQAPDYTCNGCGPAAGTVPGVALKWPTQWAQRPDLDLVPVTHLLAVDDQLLPTALVAAPDLWLARETWTGTDFVETPNWTVLLREKLQTFRDCWVAAVDIHH